MPCELARALPLTGGERVSVSSERDSEQPLWRQDAVILNEPGRRTQEAAGTRQRGSCGAGAGDGAALSITALVFGEVHARQNHRRARMSTVGFCRSFMPSARTKRSPIWRIKPSSPLASLTPGRTCGASGRGLRVDGKPSARRGTLTARGQTRLGAAGVRAVLRRPSLGRRRSVAKAEAGRSHVAGEVACLRSFRTRNEAEWKAGRRSGSMAAWSVAE